MYYVDYMPSWAAVPIMVGFIDSLTNLFESMSSTQSNTLFRGDVLRRMEMDFVISAVTFLNYKSQQLLLPQKEEESECSHIVSFGNLSLTVSLTVSVFVPRGRDGVKAVVSKKAEEATKQKMVFRLEARELMNERAGRSQLVMDWRLPRKFSCTPCIFVLLLMNTFCRSKCRYHYCSSS